jgi:hypothetical protein
VWHQLRSTSGVATSTSSASSPNGLSGFAVLTQTKRILLPFRIPILGALVNGVLGSLWPLTHLTRLLLRRQDELQAGRAAPPVWAAWKDVPQPV